MKTRDGRRRRGNPARAKLAALAFLCLAAQAGCGREFFREWANQDASEAIFEKSRDPRWRLDQFSVDPPALSRFSSPYDPDRPPAPPDDRASEAMSPVPQWPDNRLLIPAEGTGYLDQLDDWQRQRPAGNITRMGIPGLVSGPAPGGAPRAGAGAESPPGPPAAGAGSPFQLIPTPPPGDPLPGPDLNPSTTPPGAATPPAATPSPAATPPATEPSSPTPSPGPQASAGPKPAGAKDPGVTLSAFQDAGLPLPAPTAAPAAPPTTPARPPGAAPQPTPSSATPFLPTPSIGMDPDPSNRDLSIPTNPRPDLPPGEYRQSEAKSSVIASMLVPGAIDFNEAEAAGFPREFQPYIITMEQAFTLALINSRAYQTNVETLYLNALPVALQRFAFTPQFYAGMSPSTGVATIGPAGVGGGIVSPNPANQFLYQTAETGTQISALNLGTAAGVGKVFQSGARLVGGFASQIIFNFAGKNSGQPTVRSFLPLTLVQPFLRGGGRAVTLELLTQAERSLVYSVRSFAKFRQEFTASVLAGGNPVTSLGSLNTNVGFSGGGTTDPSVGFLNLVEDVQLVENARRNIAAYEQIRRVYAELILGESSGLTQLQLDQVDSQLQNAKLTLVQQRTNYRLDLDNFRLQMGLPPDTPVIADRSLARSFKDVYDAIDEWQRDANRDLDQLPEIVSRLPKLEDVVIDGRSILGVHANPDDAEDKLADVLLAAERAALEHRLDLMNARGALYDSWRQIKIQANSLQGVFNIALTNQFLTPQNNTNPFAFVDQAKTFSLVFNAELPLVRVNERNLFRSALIGYERSRRSLQSTEDTIKGIIRGDVRTYIQNYLQYEIAKRNLVLFTRQKDQAFEQIIAPPAGAAANQGAVQTNNLTGAQGQLIGSENQLIQTWYQFQISRLALYRDLGTLPYDEWEAFHELFPNQSISPAADAAARGAGAARAAAAGPVAVPGPGAAEAGGPGR